MLLIYLTDPEHVDAVWRLGADPADMRNAHDRHLAETTRVDDEGRQLLDAERREIGESWQTVKQRDARIAALEAESDTLRARLLSLLSAPEIRARCASGRGAD